MTTSKPPQIAAEAPTKTGARPVLPDEEGMRVDRWFKRHFAGLSHGALQKILRSGQVRVNGRRTHADTRLCAGDAIRLPPFLAAGDFAQPAAQPQKGAPRPLRSPDKLKSLILYEDKDVVAINKPAGLAVQGGTGLKENIDDSLMALSLDGKTRPKLVHRLDRDTSGVLLIARNDFAAAKLTAAFRARTTKKIYWAATVAAPHPEEGIVDAPLVKNGQTMHIAEDGDPDAKDAQTLYHTVEGVRGGMAFVALRPLTGRTHQLRVHLAFLGAPIWKDRLYGLTIEEEAERGLTALDLGAGLHLHARRLVIPHPRGKGLIDVTAPLPPAMRQTWRCLGFSEKADIDLEEPQRKTQTKKRR